MTHRPVVAPVLGAKYEDDETLDILDWDGTVRLRCTCGWQYSRIYSAITNAALAGRWRDHVLSVKLQIG